MTCSHNKPNPVTITIIATKDNETYKYEYCENLGEGAGIGRSFAMQGYTDIKMEWHRLLVNRKVIMLFCAECGIFHIP